MHPTQITRRGHANIAVRAAIVGLLAVSTTPMMAGMAWASAAEGVANACPAVPEVLTQWRAFPGEPPPPSAEDLAAYRAYQRELQAVDWAYLCRYREDNQRLPGRPPPRVVMIGDSITENWKQRDPDLFVDGVIDRGISGQTTPQMLLRFHQDVIALRPRVVHIMAGTNDIAGNTGPTSDTQFQHNIEAMVELAQVHGIKVVLASIPPAKAFSSRPDARPAQRIRRWNAWLRAYARERGLVFVDYYPALADAEGGLRSDLGGDGLHPSKAGYQLMDPLFAAAVAEAEHRR